MKYGTNFQESEALLAATVDDFDHIREIFGGMSRAGIAKLRMDAWTLIGFIDDEEYTTDDDH